MRFTTIFTLSCLTGALAFLPITPKTMKNTKIIPTITARSLAPSDLLVDSNYNLAAGALVVGTICGVLENFKGITARLFGAGAIVFTLFGGFLWFQTSTLRFKFNDDSFALVKSDGSSIGENVVVGGENSWKYSSFINYDFLPSESFPILVYFKETQTPENLWVETPIIVDNLKGQQHFFPCIANSEELKTNFILHNVKKAIDTAPVSLDLSKKPVL